MLDQATRLRELVMAADATPAIVSDARVSDMRVSGARIVAISGAIRGLGATTAAAQLATTLANRSGDVLLVDAYLEKPGVTTALDIASTSEGSIADVLAGRLTVAEVVRQGPAGVRVLPSYPKSGEPPQVNATARDRFLNELCRNAGNGTTVLIDTGPGLTPWTDPLWQISQAVLVVTTPDDHAIANTFDMLALAAKSHLLPAVKLVVNQCESPQMADHVHQQIGQACYRKFHELIPATPALPTNELRGKHPEYQEAMNDLASMLSAELDLITKQSAPAYPEG